MSNKFSNDGSFMDQFKKSSKRPSDDPDAQSTDVQSEDKGKTEEHPQWFLDALKRAKERAKELQSSVSPSVGSPSNSAGTVLPPTKKSKWAQNTTDGVQMPVMTPMMTAASAAPKNTFGAPMGMIGQIGQGQHMEAIQGVMITRLNRDNPAIMNYARQVFGSLDLSDAQWKQCEDQMKMNVVFQLLAAKKAETERLEQQGKVKYEYDSDEETEGGTWEHKQRKKEMEKTSDWADQLTKQSEGKHHIGDFLPPQELTRFMEKYQALKEGRDPDFSDYKDNKLTEDNVGYKMLKSMGWTEGTGLGAERQGITQPVNQNGRTDNSAIGVERPEKLSEHDDEYDAYRKRMMLAYRFRPNPLNNPRRAYY